MTCVTLGDSNEDDSITLDAEDLEGMKLRKSSCDHSASKHMQHTFNRERRGSTAQSFIYYQGLAEKSKPNGRERFKNQFEDDDSSDTLSSDNLTGSDKNTHSASNSNESNNSQN